VSAEQSSHPARQALLLAMATLSKVLIVVMRPELKVRYVHALPGDAATLPLLAWHYVVIQLSDSEKVIDPVLAFARDQTVHFVQVIFISLSLFFSLYYNSSKIINYYAIICFVSPLITCSQ
jgi:hypothetical protein